MKILYAIQGTGNGHLSRARDIIPVLQKKGDVDILVSGTQADVVLPYEIKYRFKGLSFVFGKKGGIDLLATYKKSSLKSLFKEIKSLPVHNYDIIINDFEPVSAWACKLNKKICIGLSHQSAVRSKKSPKPRKKDIVGAVVLDRYAPVDFEYGFHFKEYDNNIYTPVIRNEIRKTNPTNKKHYTVYLPAYSDEKIINVLSGIPSVQWQVFSKHTSKKYKAGNVLIAPISNNDFVNSLVTCEGILCGAGFETPAEALYLKKKLMVIPMKGQYEQQCNAAALYELGVPVITSLKKKFLPTIEAWVINENNVEVNYPDKTESIIDLVLKNHFSVDKISVSDEDRNSKITFKKLKKRSWEKVLHKISE